MSDNEDWGKEYSKLADLYAKKCKEVRELKDNNKQIIARVEAYVSKRADEMNMRSKIAEEKADMLSAQYFSGAMWHLMEVKEFLEDLKEQNK